MEFFFYQTTRRNYVIGYSNRFDFYHSSYRQYGESVVTSLKCFYCGIDTTPSGKGKKGKPRPGNARTIDHAIPKSRGGSCLADNKVMCCQSCNVDKGCLTYDEYRVVIASRKNQVSVADTKIFRGETQRKIVRSETPIGWGNKLEVAVMSGLAVLGIFIITRLIPVAMRNT